MKHFILLKQTILFSALILAFSCSSQDPKKAEALCFKIIRADHEDPGRSEGDMLCGADDSDDYDGDGVPNKYDGIGGEFARDNGAFARQDSEDHYEIGNIYQLQAIMSFKGNISLSDRLSAKYRLVSNIDASVTQEESYDGDFDASSLPAGEGFLPIGSDGNEFTGVIDGAGHTVNNLYINRPDRDDVGLFGNTSGAELENIGITNAYINGNNRTGALAGQIKGGTEVRRSYAEGSVNGGDATGGLVGFQVDGNIESSYAAGDVNILRSGNQHDAGGLVGQQDRGAIVSSYATANITGNSAPDNIGGLLGRSQAGSIENSYATGNLSGGDSVDDIGGLVGVIAADLVSPVIPMNGTITNCYASGNVNGGDGRDRVGGLLGYIGSGEVRNSYALGDVNGDEGSNDAGGLVGQNIAGPDAFMGNNYFVDDDASSGIGNISSPLSSITQATGTSNADRRIWLRDSLDETLDTGLNWDSALDAEGNPIWNNLNAAALPCIATIRVGRGGCPPF